MCVVAVMVLGGNIRDLFASTADPMIPGGTPASAPRAPLTYPTTIGQCEHGGWQNYVQFDSEAACADYISTLEP